MQHDTLHLRGTFLRALLPGDLPMTLCILLYEPLVAKLHQEVSRLNVLNSSLSLLSNLLLELDDALPLALPFLILHLFLKLEALEFGLGAPALGTGLKHGDAATVDR